MAFKPIVANVLSVFPDPATVAIAGLVSTTAQSFAGVKTFDDGIVIATTKEVDTTAAGVLNIGATNAGTVNVGKTGTTVNIAGFNINQASHNPVSVVSNNYLSLNNQQLSFTSPFTVFATIAAAKAAAPTGYDGNVCYITEKQAFYHYCTNCVRVADDDLILTTGTGGNTRWQLIQKVSRTQGDTGWVDIDSAVLSYPDSTTLRLNVTSTACISIKSNRYDLAAGNHDLTITGAAGVKFIYFDDGTGTMKSRDDLWDFSTECPVAVVYWTGTAIAGAQTEFHGIRDTVWHYWAHNYFGAQYKSGLTFTGNVQADNSTDPNTDTVQYLWSTSGYISDEDALINVGVGNWAQTLGSGLTSTTAAIIPFYYYNGSFITTAAAMSDRTPFIHTGAGTTPQWENAGVLTDATDGQYVVYHYFASPQINGQAIFARPHNAVFSAPGQVSSALAARPSSLTWSNYVEVKHIYTAVFRVETNWTGTPDHKCKLISLQDFRTVAGGPVAATNASSHSALSGLADAGAHPALAIAPDTTNFNGEFTTAETTVQLALDRLDDYDSLLDWALTKVYRTGNTVRVTEEGFVGEWRCTVTGNGHTATTSFATGVQAGYWEIVANSEGARELVNQAAHGFTPGKAVYYTGTAYALAKADVAATAEVVGVVTGATTNYFVLAKTGKITKTGWGLTAGEVYFLDASTAGAITVTEPTVVGQISKPILIATSTTAANFVNMRGTTVGGVNAVTAIGLANNTATTIHTINVPVGSGGAIEGVIKVGATTDTVLTFKVEFTRFDSTTYEITPSFGAGTMLSGLTITNSGSAIQVTLPSVTGFSTATATYNYASIYQGATLPLSVSARSVLGDTSGSAVPAGALGEEIIGTSTSNVSLSTTAGTYTDITGLSVSLTAGTWDIDALISVYFTGSDGTGGNGRTAYLRLYNSTDGSTVATTHGGFINQAIGNTVAQLTIKKRVVLTATKTIVARATTAEISSATTLTAASSNLFGTGEYIRAVRVG